MNFVIPSRDPATSPKTKSECKIENSSSILGQQCLVAGPLRLGNDIFETRRTSHCNRLWSLNSRQSLYFTSGHIWSDYAWVFLILNCNIKFCQVIEILFTLDGFTSFWEFLSIREIHAETVFLPGNDLTSFFSRFSSEITLWLLMHRKRKLISVTKIKVFCEKPVLQ